MRERQLRQPALRIPPSSVILGLTLALGAAAGALAQQGEVSACEAVGRLALPETTIVSASVVGAGSFDPPGRTPLLADLESFCRIEARSEPAINFEVWLPLQDWNGKFQGVGNGGMAGSIRYAALAGALRRGYAAASTDTGHVASGNAFDASWALGRPDLTEDFGHRALHVTTDHGKRVVEAFYGRAPDYSYYFGCSKGGQQGLMEAQRYPGDYDGIIAGDPANDWTRFYSGAHLWYSLATLSDPESFLPEHKILALGTAVNRQCDGLDGIVDGLLDDPRQCDFDPAVLTCKAGDAAGCLTPKQVQAVRKIWAGSRTSGGAVVFPGLVPGGEAAPGGWSNWVSGRERFAGLHWLAAEGFFKYMVFDDPEWDFRSFDYDRDLPVALAKTGAALDAADPDLRPFRDRGGKLIVYHGWSDADISPLASIDYFDSVVETVGGGSGQAEALAATQEFFRLFMVPGMGHCRGGPGPDRFDALAALEAWVEDGVAPARIVASKQRAGEVVRSRILCPYPQVARWSGSGSTDEAAQFECVAPQRGALAP